MDIVTSYLLGVIPPQYLIWLFLVLLVASILDEWLPKPTPTSPQWWVFLRGVITVLDNVTMLAKVKALVKPVAVVALLMVVTSFLVLQACTATQDLANACQAATGSLKTATTMRVSGQLTASQISTVTTAANLINPICSSTTPPVDLAAGVSVVTQEVNLLTPILAGSK